MIDSKDELGTRILAWYGRRGRQLPWRRTRDPYRIWVSEIMLQQTRVSFALSYYERFLQAFPTVQHLAGARLAAVLKQWEGLGYYARARNLHRAARLIIREHGGIIPPKMDSLLSLPGVGKSTAGAILSLGYGAAAPILDGNVQRVLCRLTAIREDPKQARVSRLLWQLAEGILPLRRPDRFNQGLMDIGALVCTPRKPRCQICPLRPHCEAARLGIQEEIPPSQANPPLPRRERAVALIFRDEKVLLRRRPLQGLLGGLWEFPSGWVEDGVSPSCWLSAMLKQRYRLSVSLEREMLSFSHGYTHFQEVVRVFPGRCKGGKRVASRNLRWVPPQSLKEFPLSASHRRIARIVGEWTAKKQEQEQQGDRKPRKRRSHESLATEE
ncbi:MAG: A/G-specific adenine glycosylase [candidate division NC10 bacterium]|nr:A/G-specific adenine glycosylase [candidate division NC10 bacterium]